MVDGVPVNPLNISMEVTIGDYKPVNLSLAWMSGWIPTDRIGSLTVSSSSDESPKLWSAFLRQAATAAAWKVGSLYDSDYYLCSQGGYTAGCQNYTIAGIDNPLLVMAFSGIDWLEDEPDVRNTTVCTFDLCLKSYDASVEDKQPSINQIDVTYGVKYTTDTLANKDWHSMSCWMPNTSGDPPNMNDQYSVSYIDCLNAADDGDDCRRFCPYNRQSLAFCNCYNTTYPHYVGPSATTIDVIAEAVTGRLQLHADPWLGGAQLVYNVTSGNFDTSASLFSWTNDSFTSSSNNISQYPATADSSEYANILELGPEQIMSNIADAFTKLGIDRYAVDFSGNMISMSTRVHVNWYWLLLPMLLNVSAAVYLVLTMWSSRRHKIPLWKSSVLAMFAYGLEGELQASMRAREATVSQLDEVARGMTVYLRRSDEDGNLIFAKAD